MFLTLRIKALRKEKKLSQRALALLSDIPKSTLDEIENHKKGFISPDILSRIANALGVSVEDLYK